MKSFTEVLTKVEGLFSLEVPSCPVYLGPEHLDAHNRPPRVVWVPGIGAYEAPMRTGGDEAQIHARVVRLECHCWGADYREAELIADAVVRALYQVMSGPDYVLGAGEWLETQNSSLGRVYAFEVGLMLPVTLEPDPAAKAMIQQFVETP